MLADVDLAQWLGNESVFTPQIYISAKDSRLKPNKNLLHVGLWNEASMLAT